MLNSKVKLSRTTVEKLEPSGSRYTVWDTDIIGFGVRVSPASQRSPRGARTYIARYRMPGMGRAQQPRTLTLGRHGVISADRARQLALDALAKVRAGIDPTRERAQIKQRETVERLAALYLAWLRRHKKPRAVESAEGALRNHVLPAIGRMAVADVQRRDIKRMVDRLELQGKRRTGGLVVQVCRAMFNRAELDEEPWNLMRPAHSNPCAKLAVHLGEQRERALSLEEIGRLGQAIRDARKEGENPWLVGALLLWLLTGARLREIMHARWSWVDWHESALRLPESKTGKKVIHLSPVAMAVLERIPHLDNNPFIICGVRPGRPMIAPYKGFRRLMARARITGVTPHDLRRTYASMGLGGGLTLPQIGALLGHSTAETTNRYAFLQTDPARQSTRQIGEALAQLLDGPSQLRLFQPGRGGEN